MEPAVHGRLDQVGGVVRTDYDVASLARPRRGARPVDREREDVGRLVLAAVVAVELADALLLDELDRQVPVKAGGRHRSVGRLTKLCARGVDLDHAPDSYA